MRQARPAKALPVKNEPKRPRTVDAPTTTRGSIPKIGCVGLKMGRLRTAPSAAKNAKVAGTPPANLLNQTSRFLYLKKSFQFILGVFDILIFSNRGV